MVLQESVVPSFLLLCDTLLHGSTTVGLSIHQLKDIWVVSFFLVITNKAIMNIYVQLFV